jgi:hypothetical protein
MRRIKTSIVLVILLMCAGAASSRTPRKDPAFGAEACATCHSTDSLTLATSKYFEHYKTVHREALSRKLDCRTCHSPLFTEFRSRVTRSQCITCHGSQKSGALQSSSVAHRTHIAAAVSCSACHTGARHRIDRLQILNACGNCH